MTLRTIITALFFVQATTTIAQVIPNAQVTTIDGDTIQLNSFLGKKIMIVVLPISHSPSDSLELINIESMNKLYNQKLTIIGVPSYEDGFHDSLQFDLKDWYRNKLQLSFTITNGMYTQNSSGDMQSPAFKWLTAETLNGHFATNIISYGQKFFLNELGELKVVLDSATLLNQNILDLIMQ
jgi:glutathione peroxidase-family protein